MTFVLVVAVAFDPAIDRQTRGRSYRAEFPERWADEQDRNRVGQVAEAKRGFAPAVVVLELHMPVMDGYDFPEAVRAMPRWVASR